MEYALLLALRKMKALGKQTFVIKLDSKVIQEHVEKERGKKSGTYQVSEESLRNGKIFQGLYCATYPKG